MRRDPRLTGTEQRLHGLRLGWPTIQLCALAALICLRTAFAAPPAGATGSAVAIIANPSVPVDDLSLAQLRKIFLGERQFWNSNLRVVLLVPSSGVREREIVLRSLYGMTEAQYNEYWIAMVMRAEVTSAPKTVSSAEMADELIAGIPGSIGFIPADKIQPGVKVLRVNGKLPGQSGYPLQ
jgi:ABC-type phosphate transport system substrate-binding protein